MSTSETTPVDAPVVIVRDNKVPPKLGGQVIYVLSERDSPTSPGKHRPAVIVDFDNEGLVILQVFTNGGPDQLANVHRVVGVRHDEDDKADGTWHWMPPRQLVFTVAPTPPVQIHEPEVPTGVELTSLKDPFPVADPPSGFEKDDA